MAKKEALPIARPLQRENHGPSEWVEQLLAGQIREKTSTIKTRLRLDLGTHVNILQKGSLLCQTIDAMIADLVGKGLAEPSPLNN